MEKPFFVWPIVDFPAWMSPRVRLGIERYEAEPLPPVLPAAALGVTTRFKKDARPKRVYEVLKQRDRRTGGYRWNNRLADPLMDPGEALDDLMGRVLYQAARSLRDGRRADKGEEAAALKVEILHEAAVLEKSATACAAVGELADAECILRVAARWAAMAKDVRGADDPLTIQRDHGDHMQRAVQCDVAWLFLDHLGNGMHTLAAMIAGAAVGNPDLDASVSRAALSKAKTDD